MPAFVAAGTDQHLARGRRLTILGGGNRVRRLWGFGLTWGLSEVAGHMAWRRRWRIATGEHGRVNGGVQLRRADRLCFARVFMRSCFGSVNVAAAASGTTVTMFRLFVRCGFMEVHRRAVRVALRTHVSARSSR